jgi:hypothetical protein
MIVARRLKSDLNRHAKGGERLDKSVDIFPHVTNCEAFATPPPRDSDQNFIAMLRDINRYQNGLPCLMMRLGHGRSPLQLWSAKPL